MRPRRSSAAVIRAPVLPADIMAFAVPSFTISTAITSEESFLVRTAFTGLSSFSITSSACTI